MASHFRTDVSKKFYLKTLIGRVLFESLFRRANYLQLLINLFPQLFGAARVE